MSDRSEYIPGKRAGRENSGEEKGEINPFDYPGTERVRIRHLEMREISQEDIDRVLQLTGQLEAFEVLMMYYDCALAEVRTKLDVLNKAALIYIAARNMGFEPDGMTDGQMQELSEVFHLPK